MVNSRAKGAIGENKVKEFLDSRTPYTFERTPGSGNGSIKGDLYIKGYKNVFCIEVKNYADPINLLALIVNEKGTFVDWWIKLQKQSKLQNQEPLLIFKYNRSKLFVATKLKPCNVNKYIDITWLNCYITELGSWIEKEQIKWLHSPTTIKTVT